MTFLRADWDAGRRPSKGWDCADAIADGWTPNEIIKFMRDLKADDLSLPDEPAKAPAPTPKPAPAVAPVQVAAPAPARPARVRKGAAGADEIDGFSPVQTGSDVELAGILAERLIYVCEGRVVYADAAFWAWGPTAWQTIEDRSMRLAVHKFDNVGVSGKNTGLSVSKGKIDGVIHETGTILGDPRFFDNPAVALNAQNTVITVDAAGVVGTRPHDPEDRFRFTIPADFTMDTDMTPPVGSLLHKLLYGAFGDDADAAEKMWLIAEILGAAAFGMATRLPQPKAFVFLGETASNGKSTIASLLSCLLPDGAVSAIKPADFADPARIVHLAGKAANVADEISGAVAGEVFKAAVTGNALEGRDLYRSAMTFIPRAIHVFTTNKLPSFNGGLDRGLQRRLVVLTFNRPIPAHEVIADIADRIRAEELDLLLGFAIAGAIRLVRNKGYTSPASSAEALRGWLLLDPINEWFDAQCRPADHEPADGWPRTRVLFSDFKTWAVEQGHNERYLPPISTFVQRLKALPGIIIKRRSDGTVAAGITLSASPGF